MRRFLDDAPGPQHASLFDQCVERKGTAKAKAKAKANERQRQMHIALNKQQEVLLLLERASESQQTRGSQNGYGGG